MKILIAPNSYKESADSDLAAGLFKKYLGKDSSLSLEELPVSDGGDGFLNVCKAVFDLEILSYEITAPYDESTFTCEVGYDKEAKKIYIESARVLGLRVIPSEKRQLLKLSSKGMGDLLIRIIEDIKHDRLSVKEVVIGVGGTGTNDLGLGACSRFGLEFYDIYGKKDSVIPEFFYRIKDLNWSAPEIPFNIKIIADVDNPLVGVNGATRTFGPQKGADKGEVEVMELGFHKIINILKTKKIDRSFDNLSGAGGGLAAGLHIFFNADILTARHFINYELNLEQKLPEADIVITGEGNFDKQSIEGKGAGIIVKRATELSKRVILCCGSVDEGVRDNFGENVEIIELTTFFSSPEESIENFEKGIQSACKQINSLL